MAMLPWILFGLSCPHGRVAGTVNLGISAVLISLESGQGILFTSVPSIQQVEQSSTQRWFNS